jgi:transaldolase
LPPPEVLAEIDAKIDVQKLQDTLMREGVAKFAEPQKALLKLVREKREAFVTA